MLKGDGGSLYKIGGSGFKERDTVTVKADITTGTVTFLTNGIKQASHTLKKIKDASLNWVLYI